MYYVLQSYQIKPSKQDFGNRKCLPRPQVSDAISPEEEGAEAAWDSRFRGALSLGCFFWSFLGSHHYQDHRWPMDSAWFG